MKICGICRQVDAEEVIRLGFSYIGFNFFSGSKRFITPERASEIWKKSLLTFIDKPAPPQTNVVGVFVNASIAAIEQTVAKIPALAIVQLHGNETPELVADIKKYFPSTKIWKALRIANKNDLENINEYTDMNVADLILLDSKPQSPPDAAESWGGTGQKFDWRLLDNLSQEVRAKIGLAGGIKPTDISELGQLDVKLIDMASGVEAPLAQAGEKNHDLMREVFRGWKTIRRAVGVALFCFLTSTHTSALHAQADSPPLPPAPSEADSPADIPAKTPPAPIDSTSDIDRPSIINPLHDVKLNPIRMFIDRDRIHVWERYIRGFRREHHFSISAGSIKGNWRINRLGTLTPQTFARDGYFTKLGYTFHLPIWSGFGYFLGSSMGMITESRNGDEAFISRTSWMLPGLTAGLIWNITPGFRIGGSAEAYLERFHDIFDNDANPPNPHIDVTTETYDGSAFFDWFYGIGWAVRFEVHKRQLFYHRPPQGVENQDVDVSFTKTDEWIGGGLVYHLL